MAMTFTPAVCGGRQFRFWLHVFLFWAGAMIGAVATGLAAYGAVQQLRLVLPHGAVAGVAVGLMGVCIARDLGARVWVPYRKQQVPEWLRKMVPTSVSAFAYGAMIGLGFATRYTYSAHSAMVVGAAFLNLPAIIALAATFAAGKSVAVAATPKRAPLSEVGHAFDERFFFRRYGAHTLRAASVLLSSAVAFAIIASSGG